MNFCDRLLLANIDRFKDFGKSLESKHGVKSYSPDEKFGVAFVCYLLNNSSLDLHELSALFNSINCITDYGYSFNRFDISEHMFIDDIISEFMLGTEAYSKFKHIKISDVALVIMDIVAVWYIWKIYDAFESVILEVSSHPQTSLIMLSLFALMICFVAVGHLVGIIYTRISNNRKIILNRSVVCNKEPIVSYVLSRIDDKGRIESLCDKIDSTETVKGYYSALAEMELIYMEMVETVGFKKKE